VINFQSNRFGFGSGSQAMDDVSCTGEEPHILSCSYATLGAHNCAIYESVGVQCSEYVHIILQFVCFPGMIQSKMKRMAMIVIIMQIIFCIFNAYPQKDMTDSSLCDHNLPCYILASFSM